MSISTELKVENCTTFVINMDLSNKKILNKFSKLPTEFKLKSLVATFKIHNDTKSSRTGQTATPA